MSNLILVQHCTGCGSQDRVFLSRERHWPGAVVDRVDGLCRGCFRSLEGNPVVVGDGKDPRWLHLEALQKAEAQASDAVREAKAALEVAERCVPQVAEVAELLKALGGPEPTDKRGWSALFESLGLEEGAAEKAGRHWYQGTTRLAKRGRMDHPDVGWRFERAARLAIDGGVVAASPAELEAKAALAAAEVALRGASGARAKAYEQQVVYRAADPALVELLTSPGRWALKRLRSLIRGESGPSFYVMVSPGPGGTGDTG